MSPNPLFITSAVIAASIPLVACSSPRAADPAPAPAPVTIIQAPPRKSIERLERELQIQQDLDYSRALNQATLESQRANQEAMRDITRYIMQ